jgi:hypothetical protein
MDLTTQTETIFDVQAELQAYGYHEKYEVQRACDPLHAVQMLTHICFGSQWLANASDIQALTSSPQYHLQ